MSRLNDEDQRPFSSKAAAALTSMVGAAAFTRLGGGKAIAKGVPKVTKFMNTVADDISDMRLKDWDAENISGLIKRHISDDNSTFRKLINSTDEPVNLKTQGKNLIAAMIKLKEIELNSEADLRKIFNSHYADDIVGGLSKKYNIKDNAIKDQLDQLVRHSINKKDLVLLEDGAENVLKINNELIDSYISPDELESFVGENKQEFFNDLINAVTREKEIAYDSYKTKHMNKDGISDLAENIKNEITGKTFEETFGAENIELQEMKNHIGKTFKEAFGIDEENTFIDAILNGERGVTLKEYVDDVDNFADQHVVIKDEIFSLKELAKDFLEKNEDAGNIFIDAKNIRKTAKGEIINYGEIGDIKHNAMRSFAGTLFGKLAKVTDVLAAEESGFINFLEKGKTGQLIAPLDGKEKILGNNYVQMFGKFYRIDNDNNLEHIKELDNMYTQFSGHGTMPRLLSKMFGTGSEREATNKFTKWLDINTSSEANFIDNLTRSKGLIGDIARSNFGGHQYNIIDKVLDQTLAEKDPLEYRKNLKDINSIFSGITKAPNKKTLSKIENAVKNDVSKEILSVLQSDDQEEIISVLNKYSSDLKNKDLTSLIRVGAGNRERAAKMLSIKGTMLTGEKNVLKYKDMLKREAFKEAMLAETVNEKTGSINHDNILKALDKANLKESEYKNAKNLAHWVNIQYNGKVFNSAENLKDLRRIQEANEAALDLITSESKDNKQKAGVRYIKEIKKDIQKIRENYVDLTTRTVDRERPGKEIRAAAMNPSIVMRKAYTPSQYAMDMLKNINEATKDRAAAATNAKENTKRFAMQFVAGKNTPEYVTTYTMIPYFFTERLVDPMNKFGAGFSSKNMGSTADMWKAIMLKRVMPTAAGITALSYLNYEAKNLTGTSITGALAQGVANVDLGIRKIADATGVGAILDAERRVNPITQYWFGEDYQDSEERKDYYENGYDAVRKGRWWAFGSASEFRGGKISYYQPNFVKRANSDWRDIGIYGSSEEKWAHSWIPTLRHPFAPMRRLLDPYWLERKHYHDRPYLETAPLFSTGTPWGAVLNPTLGEMIKPVRKMHRNETRRGLIDPRTLIQERNERIKEKAIDKEHGNLFEVSQDGVYNVSYTPKALADPGNAMITIKAGNGRVQSIDYNGVEYNDNVPYAKDAVIANDQEDYVNEEGVNYVGITPGTYSNNESSIINSLEATRIGSFISNTANSVLSPTETIRIVNNDIIKKASSSPQGSTFKKTNLAKLPAKLASQRIVTRQDESDLLLTTSRHDFISDALFSGKQLSGIYGYGYDTASGDKGRRVRAESADKMASFKTAFWDANMGGLGGGVMEIARRFFPHDDHSWTEINPIRNTMPDWMPERFKTGDPYRKVPKGEMRLPGAGYESIHKLRSDEYGKYGALDRMRILGDIAPWSDEYKVWRDIAQKTVTDEAGKKEIQAIKKRVEKQSRAHEFYNYKFLGSPTEINKATVESVDGTTITTTSGTKYNMAGIKLASGVDIGNYIAPGMNIHVEHLKNTSEEDDEKGISAAVFINGENINKMLLDTKQATQKENGSAMDAKAVTSHLGQFYGAAMEAIAHAPIPFVHNKIMRIDTALESYKNERVYGTPYSTWDHPIKGFINPAFQKSWGRGAIGQGIAIGGWALAEQMWRNPEKITNAMRFLGFEATETGVNRAASVLMNMANPGSFAASMIAAIPTGLMSESEGIKGLLSTSVFGSGVQEGLGRNAARIGAVTMLAGYGITRSDKPIESTAIFSVAGMALAKQLNHKSFNIKEGAVAGAVAGFTISALRNPRFDKDKMFGIYTPEDTKKRWDIDEYYDRLEYIKYQGLYEKAARKAKLWEKTDIKKIIQANEYARKENKKKIERLNKRLEKISNSNLEDSRKEELISRINSDLYKLQTSKQMLKGGKYTKAAIAYKQAADSTIYGLKEDATTQDVLRAIPKGDKDFFMEFMKEKDTKERKKILKYVSPYQRKALQIAWGEKVDKVDSNSEYFKRHFLPGVFWAGWKPTVDMEHVKIKTIENEGMLLSDFGIYESQGNEPAAVMAPSVGKFDSANTGGLGLEARLQGALNGTGLLGVKVSVSQTSASGIEVIANISNSLKITEYKIRESLNSVTGARMFY